MNYPKVIDGELYLCSNGVDHLLSDNILDSLRTLSGVTTTNINSIKVLLLYRKDNKSVKLLKSIQGEESSEKNVLFSLNNLLCYGKSIKNYVSITPEELDKIISYPTIYIGDEIIRKEDMIDIITNMKDYQPMLKDLLDRRNTLYYRNNIYSLHGIVNLFSYTYNNFFFFKSKLLYGNIMSCKEPDLEDYNNYTRDKLYDLYRLLFNFNPLKYMDKIIDINNYFNTFTENQKNTLRKYLFDIVFYGRDKPNKDTYGDIEFFSRIRIINTNRTLMDFYNGNIYNIKDVIDTINSALEQ